MARSTRKKTRSNKTSSKTGKGTRLNEVAAALDALGPPRLAQDWDNVGLLAGDLNARVRRALLCIDLMPAVVDEAIAAKVELVIAYHPPLFRPIRRLVSPGDRMEAGIHRCIRKGIAIYSHHTALDAARGGTNDVLAAICGATDCTPLEPTVEDPTVGIGRVGTLKTPSSLVRLARAAKRRSGASTVSIVGDPERVVKRIIVVVGAAGDLPFGVEGGLGRHDVVVTGEMRHHDALRILRVDANAVVLSHWSSERPALPVLAELVAERVSGLETLVSVADREPFARV